MKEIDSDLTRDAVLTFAVPILLDGEVIVINDKGQPDFEALVHRIYAVRSLGPMIRPPSTSALACPRAANPALGRNGGSASSTLATNRHHGRGSVTSAPAPRMPRCLRTPPRPATGRERSSCR